MMRFVKLVLFILALPYFSLTANAQDESGKNILVLDESGSMWGQIDGITKIEIAQSVIGNLLKDLPDDQELGLTAYGHNRKGDCSDIETLVAPALGTKGAIAKAVNAIKPKGKTPLSEAVMKAAEALKFTEDKATVILISDGRETCDFDPCAVGKQLEESGVDFTAHVVGFDVANPADRAQLQCLAENTGGEFLTASNASELTKALEKVSAPLPPEPRKITFRAVEEGTDKRIDQDLVWTLTNTDTGEVVVNPEGMPQIEAMLLPGKYKAEVLRTTDEATGELSVGVFKNTNTAFNVELPPYLPKATLNAVEQAPAGSNITVEWTGPNEEYDYISLAEVGERPARYITYSYTKKGTPAPLLMPAKPGDYELRYFLSNGKKVLATRPITATPVEATLEAAATAMAGDELVVSWSGPDYKGDYISIAQLDDKGGRYEKYTYTAKGSPLRLQMPAEPGTYQLRYVMSQKSTVLATRTVKVTDVEASLTAADVATVGDSIVIEWTGPDYKSDYIDVAVETPVATKQTRHINYTYTNKGSPLRLQMPSEPGDYVIRYIMSQDAKILAKRPVKVEAAVVSIDIPDTAKAGEPLLVNWNGPDYKNDYISVADVGAKGGKYYYYSYTKEGSPLRLKMPLDPGEYEVRYILNQDNVIKAKKTIKIEPVDVSLDFADVAKIAEPFLINWQGPDYKNDYISVAEIGEGDGRYLNYTYTKQGSPLRLVMPTKPGEYEVRYIANGNPDKALVRKTISVETVEASVKLSGDATTTEPALIEWAGPDYKGDFIGVGELGTDKYLTYTYTRDGSPLRLKMPDKPGTYELRYFLHKNSTIVAREQIEVK
jgi:Ca-activated chloride channel family protein